MRDVILFFTIVFKGFIVLVGWSVIFRESQYQEVVIKDNVWIEGKVTIANGVYIGRGSIIGSNSVVTKDILPYSVVAGVPARVLQSFQ